MKKPVFTGVCTALVTPFIGDKVNYPLARILLNRQLEAGVKAVVLSGTTGEAPTLTDNEKFELIRQCKQDCGEECTIIAGTGSNSTTHAIELSKQAEEAGADALLVVSPYYNKSTNEGLFQHYLSIAHSVSLPVIIYNVPSRTGLDIPVSVYQRLSRIPNIAGVKEASTDMSKIIQIQNACKKEFAIYSGNDDLTVPIMSLGGQGVISVVSNVCPKEMVYLTQAAINGDFETARDMQLALHPLTRILFNQVNPVPVKAAMACLGFDCGECRLPLGPADSNTISKIQEYFCQ